MAERSIEETAAEVLRLDAADASAPWQAQGDRIFADVGHVVAETYGPPADERATLIATYRTAAPELAREVQRLQEARSKANEASPRCRSTSAQMPIIATRQHKTALELAVKLRGYAQTWKRFARRKRQEQLDAEHTWLEEHIRVAEMEVQLAELRTAHRAAVDEAARLRTTLAGAEVLCNALKAQAAGQGRVTDPVTDQAASPAAVSGAAGVTDSVTAPVTDTTRISYG